MARRLASAKATSLMNMPVIFLGKPVTSERAVAGRYRQQRPCGKLNI